MSKKGGKKDIGNRIHQLFKNNWNISILAGMFITVLVIRLSFALKTAEFSSDSAYFVLEQVETIAKTGFPYVSGAGSGALSFFPPVFYYVLAFFNMFMPIFIVGKVVPNVLAASTIFIVYAISMKFTRNQEASIFAASLSGFIPVFFLETFNSISIYSLIVPLVLFSFYAFLMIGNDDRFIPIYIGSILLLSFTHPTVFFVVAAQLLYFTFVKVEGLKHKNVEIEAILVSIFVVIWSQFLIFKNAFIEYGPNIIWQNIPSQVFTEYFHSITLIDAVAMIGIVPTFAGVSVFFRYVRERKSKFIFFFLSYSIPIFVMLWFRMIIPTTGLILLSASLVVVLSKYYQIFLNYLKKTKFSSLRVPIVAVAVLVTFFTTLSPTFALIDSKLEEAPDYEKREILDWVERNTPEDSTILSSYEEGFLVGYYTKRTTVIDSNFLLNEDIDTIMDDINQFFTTIYLIDALKIVEKYDIDMVFVSDSIVDRYGDDSMQALENERCFKNIFADKEGNNKLYEVTCSLRSGETDE